MYTPYDFNQAIAHRAEYVEERLKSGSPVVALSYSEGILIATAVRGQRKIFEIYDHLAYSALGNQADVETVRLAAIDFAHQEGFRRSPADVSIQRLLGFAISPIIKRSFSDPTSAPHVLRALFVEINKTPETDLFYTLNYDGEFTIEHQYSAVSGSEFYEDEMRRVLEENSIPQNFSQAIQLAKHALIAGHKKNENADLNIEMEAAILKRDQSTESTFKLLSAEEINLVAN